MKTYQIIIQSNEDIDGIDFQSQDGESAKVVSIIDITSMYNEQVTNFIKDFNISDDVGEA